MTEEYSWTNRPGLEKPSRLYETQDLTIVEAYTIEDETRARLKLTSDFNTEGFPIDSTYIEIPMSKAERFINALREKYSELPRDRPVYPIDITGLKVTGVRFFDKSDIAGIVI